MSDDLTPLGWQGPTPEQREFIAQRLEEVRREIEAKIFGMPVPAEDPTLPPIVAPDGWDPPAKSLRRAQEQYANAALTAENISAALNGAVSDWRTLTVKPRITEAMLVAAHMGIVMVLEEIRLGGGITETTYQTLLGYQRQMQAQGVAITEFVDYSVSALKAAATGGDPEALRVLGNLNASDLGDLLFPDPVDGGTTPP